jgi:ribosomal protein L28
MPRKLGPHVREEGLALERALQGVGSRRYWEPNVQGKKWTIEFREGKDK